MTSQDAVTNPRTKQRAKETLRIALVFAHGYCLSLAAGQNTFEAVIRSGLQTLEAGSYALGRRSRMMNVARLFETLLRTLRRRLSGCGIVVQMSFRLAVMLILIMSFISIQGCQATSHHLCRLLPLSRRHSRNNLPTVPSGHLRRRRTLYCGASGGRCIRSLS